MKNVFNAIDTFQFPNYLNTYKIVKGTFSYVAIHIVGCATIITLNVHTTVQKELRTAIVATMSFHLGDRIMMMSNSNLKLNHCFVI